MAATTQLSPGDREFFQVVSRALFSNPFGQERTELDRKIAGWVGGESEEETMERAIERILQRVDELERAGKARLDLYRGEMASTMRNVYAFEVFYRFRHEFRDLIKAQIREGDDPLPVRFAREAVANYLRRGLSEEMAVRLFGISYQAWRAFYFIHRNLVGVSPAMRQLRFALWNNVFSQNLEWYGLYLWERMEHFSTLLLGDTGTGKGTAAAAIGQSGFIPFDPRKGRFTESFTRSFISLNLSQFPESLIESELFGHRKGAFTGAFEHHDGIFSRCTPHGSIFLDEIGDLSGPLQIKLLRVLQERTFAKVGSHEQLRFRGRVIAATNRRLDDLRRSGHFRDDLYYRLCSNTIVLPTLRQRFREDPREFDLMLGFTVRRMMGEEQPALVAWLREILERDLGRDYPWPGNVRELEQAVRSALLISTYPGDTALAAPSGEIGLLSRIQQGDVTVEELVSGYCAMLYKRYGTYEEVARRTKLDWRTVRKHIRSEQAGPDGAEKGAGKGLRSFFRTP